MSVVVGGLVIAFGIWGIGDIFRGGSNSAVATVGGGWLFGGTRLEPTEYQRLYQQRLQQISQQIRQPLTPDQARAFGLDRQVLRQWVDDTTLDRRAAQMGLGISQADVVDHVTQDPAFQDKDKKFDPTRFRFIIQQLGFSEQGYVAEQSRETLRRQITSTVSADTAPPKVVTEAIDRYLNEQREADYIVLTPAQVGDIPPPAADVLAKYFDERKALFRAPEYRGATIIPLTTDAVGASIEVSDDEAKAFFDKNPERFSVPERREVQQILFTDKDAAHKAAERLAGGLSFDDLAKEPDVKDKVQNLGLVPKLGMPDQKVADDAFKLTAGQSTGAIDELYVSTIAHVSKIEPGNAKTFADVEADIKKGIAQQRAADEVRKMRDKVDEEVGGGATLKEIADKLKLPVISIAAIDRSGRDPDGKQIDLPKNADVLDAIFATQKGVENDPLQTRDGGMVWYDVTDVTESHDRKLDEIKDKVAARWHDDEVTKRINAKTTELLDKLKGGTAIADLATAEKLKVEHTPWLKRNDNNGVLPPDALSVLFRTAKGAAASAEGKAPNERIVFVTSAITTPAFDPASPAVKQLDGNLRTQIANDFYSQYIAKVRDDLGVSIDQAALADALGASRQQP